MSLLGARAGKIGLLASTILCVGLSAPAMAQQTAAPVDPWVATDENGVDLTNGRYYLDILEGSIGILPRRLMVRSADHAAAERAMRDNDVDLGR